jgi:Protein of unknown function (DUF1214)
VSERSEPPELRAWRDLCHRLEAVGERLLTDAFPSDPPDRAEGFAHLAEQVVCWLGWHVGHADPRHPTFHRQNDLVTQWGGPNVDNAYRHARIDPALRYRIRGRMHSCDEFILAVRAGFMHQERWGTLVEVTASEIGIGRGDEFELLLGEGGTVALPDGAAMVSIREYYFDWQADEPATFTIECLDEDGPAPRVLAEDLAAQLAETATSVEHSMAYWNDYLLAARAQGVDNTFAPSLQLAKGLSLARYAFCFWALGPDEALLVTSDVPDARYWSLHLYTMGWFEPIDPAGRITTRNHKQTTVGADGRIRAVVAHRDPGGPNWIDTGGRADGLLTLRWFWPTGDRAPVPDACVVPWDAVADGGAGVDRPGELQQRRRHLAWRFRT